MTMQHIPSLYSTTPIAFGGTQKGLEAAIAPLDAGIKAETLIQRFPKSCAVTHLVGSYDKRKLERTYGLGEGMGGTLEAIFEFSPSETAAENVKEALHAIPVGSNTALTPFELLVRIFTDPSFGLQRHTLRFEQHFLAIDAGLNLLEKMLGNTPVTFEEWDAVRATCAELAHDESATATARGTASAMMLTAYYIDNNDYNFYLIYEEVFSSMILPYETFLATTLEVFASAPLSHSGPTGDALRENRMALRRFAEVPQLRTRELEPA
jgi:hypothetical protein